MPWLGGGRRLWPRAKYTANLCRLVCKDFGSSPRVGPPEADSADSGNREPTSVPAGDKRGMMGRSRSA